MQYKQAREIATRILKTLEPYCKRIDVVGSVRREKPEVKDIEVTCVPQVQEVRNLFGEVTHSQRSPIFCKAVRSLGKVLQGDIETGRYVKLLLPEGVNFDLFTPVEADYVRQMIIRTGCAEYSNKIIAVGWLKKGFCGTDDGLRLQKECYQKKVGRHPDGRDKMKWYCGVQNPTPPPTFETELDYYKFFNLEWIEPNKRS